MPPDGTGQIPESVDDVTAQTAGSYDEFADQYAAATARYEAFPGLVDDVSRFIGSLEIDGPLVDIGCGGGRDARLMAGAGRAVIALDVSANILNAARNTTPERVPVTFVQANAVALPLRSNSASGVWASGSLLHLRVESMPTALAEIARVLRPKGLAAISMRAGDLEGWRRDGTVPSPRWFSLIRPGRFERLVTSAGLVDVDVVDCGRDNWYIVHARAAG